MPDTIQKKEMRRSTTSPKGSRIHLNRETGRVEGRKEGVCEGQAHGDKKGGSGKGAATLQIHPHRNYTERKHTTIQGEDPPSSLF